MADPHAITSSRTVYAGRLIELGLVEVLDPDGQAHRREVVRHPGAVAIVPLLEEGGRGKVILVKQYRPAVGRELWEVPAGTLEPGESPQECAARELQEEVGYRAREWRRLAEFYTTPGFCDEKMTLFLAQGLEPVAEKRREEDKFIRVAQFELGEIPQMLRRGELEDAKTIIGLTLLLSESGDRGGGALG